MRRKSGEGLYGYADSSGNQKISTPSVVFLLAVPAFHGVLKAEDSSSVTTEAGI